MKVYNAVFNYNLSPNALKVYVYLSYCKNELGTAIVKTATIASTCAIQSLSSIHTALAELDKKGLVKKYKRRNAEGDTIANGYRVTQLHGGWFTLKLDNGQLALPKSSFMVYLYLLRCKNRAGRAWPSFSHMAAILHISRNTIIAAIKCLISCLWLRKAIQWAGKHNLYILSAPAAKTAQKNSAAPTPRHSHIETNSHINDRFLTPIIATISGFVKSAKRQASFYFTRVVQKLYSSI